MKKVYLLVFSSTLGTMEEIKACMNSIKEIRTWRTDIPNAFYIISDSDAKKLASLIRDCRGGKGRFIITEIPVNKGGWLTPESWYLINNLKLKPKE